MEYIPKAIMLEDLDLPDHVLENFCQNMRMLISDQNSYIGHKALSKDPGRGLRNILRYAGTINGISGIESNDIKFCEYCRKQLHKDDYMPSHWTKIKYCCESCSATARNFK